MCRARTTNLGARRRPTRRRGDVIDRHAFHRLMAQAEQFVRSSKELRSALFTAGVMDQICVRNGMA
jgi:hypothetical protein